MTDVPARLTAALSDRYRVLRELGEGGMATVYLAEDLKHGRRVAVKVLHPELAAVIGAERFLAEIRTTANLQHPHILPLFDSGEAAGFLYYVMPFVEGESLRDRLDREKQLPVEEAVRLAREVADGLDDAHRRGVIHRDIKPANILLHDGRPLLADFGLALAVSAAGGGRLTETGLRLGTPHYMSPEQATADRDLTARSDVYSLGAVLYEMLAGHPPHTGPSAQAILVKILTEEPPSLTSERRTVPANVSGAVARAVEKLPADRFEGARAFADALADPDFRYEATAPSATQLVPLPGGATRGRDRWIPVAAGVLLGLTLAYGVSALGRGDSTPARPVRLSLDVGDLAVGGGQFDISPDGSLFVVADVRRGLFIRGASEERFRRLAGTENALMPQFTPDGAWILFSRGGAIQRIPSLGGGVFTEIPRPPRGDLLIASRTADGTLFGAGPGGLFRLSPDGGEPEDITHLTPPDFRTPEPLPDGSGLLASRPAGHLMLVDFEADSVIELGVEGFGPRYSPTGHVLYVSPRGVLHALPFDLDRRRATAPPIPVMEGMSVQLFLAAFQLSSDGTLMYATGLDPEAGDVSLVLFDVGSGEDVETLPLPRDFYEDGRFSPDGRLRALEIEGRGVPQLHVYDMDAGALSQLTFEGESHHPRWSPEGDSLLFASERPGSVLEDVWIQSVDGGGPARLLRSEDGDLHPEARPSGRLLVFARDTDGDLAIMGLDADTITRPFLRDPWRESRLAVSPDGGYAAYESDELGRTEVFLRRFPGGEGKWRISPGGGRDTRWSPDGSVLYYWSPEGALVAADLRTDPTPAVTGRRVVAEGLDARTFWDLHPDGRRFLVGRIATIDVAAGQSLWVVVNWFEELRRVLAEGR